ncbi:acyl-CoA thioesterase [Elusimicrobiota bacterium]
MEIKVYYRDTDCGGVVYYANYLDYFERARTEWMDEKGAGIKGLRDGGIQFIVKHAEINYKSPAAYGEILQVDTQVDKVGGASITFTYEIKEKESRRLIVTGSTQLVCINKKLRPMRMPDELQEKLRQD